MHGGEKASACGVARAEAHSGVLPGQNQMCAPGEHPGVDGGQGSVPAEAIAYHDMRLP